MGTQSRHGGARVVATLSKVAAAVLGALGVLALFAAVLAGAGTIGQAVQMIVAGFLLAALGEGLGLLLAIEANTRAAADSLRAEEAEEAEEPVRR